MKQTDAQLRASKKYHDKLDTIVIRVPAGEKQKIVEFAASKGESVNAFVKKLIYDELSKSDFQFHEK